VYTENSYDDGKGLEEVG